MAVVYCDTPVKPVRQKTDIPRIMIIILSELIYGFGQGLWAEEVCLGLGGEGKKTLLLLNYNLGITLGFGNMQN